MEIRDKLPDHEELAAVKHGPDVTIEKQTHVQSEEHGLRLYLTSILNPENFSNMLKALNLGHTAKAASLAFGHETYDNIYDCVEKLSQTFGNIRKYGMLEASKHFRIVFEGTSEPKDEVCTK